MTYQGLRQSLPTIESPEAFLASHQVAIAQLAIEYCNALVDDPALSAAYFPGVDFGQPANVVFAGGNRDLVLQPLIDRMMGFGIQTQPDYADVLDELGYATSDGARPDSLTDRLLDNGAETRSIAKGICAAVLGSAVTLVQ
jgi:hypothetical protein